MVPPSQRRSKEFANSHTKSSVLRSLLHLRGCNEDLGGIFFIHLKIADCSFGRLKIGTAPAVDILKITFFFFSGAFTVPVLGETSRKTMRKNLR